MTGMTNYKARILPALVLSLVLFILALFLFSCPPSEKNLSVVSAPSGWDRLILYTSMQDEVISPLVREFENRTGIWVSVKTGGSLAELSRISSGGEADWDVMLAPEDVLESSSELFAPARDLSSVCSSPSQTVFPYSRSDIVIIYNTKLVTLYPPDSWSDLLDPVWKGRIAVFDPRDTGEGYALLQAVSQGLSRSEGGAVGGGGSPGRPASSGGAASFDGIVSPYELSELLSGRCFPDIGELIRAVADGTCYIGIVSEDAALRAVEAGYDITIVLPQEETPPVSNAMAVLGSSPRRENAGRFLAFLLDETIQEYLEERFFFGLSP